VGTGAVGRTSGAAGSGLDLGNLLKPALARGRLQVVSASFLELSELLLQTSQRLAWDGVQVLLPYLCQIADKKKLQGDLAQV